MSLPYDDEQLSRILSAKEGDQLLRYGEDWYDWRTCEVDGGCINQVAFLEPSPYNARIGYGPAASRIASAFDETIPSRISRLTAEGFLAWLEKKA